MTGTPSTKSGPKYGLVLGRFQPFHIAHEAIIHEVIADGLEPIIILGSSNVINERNPYTFSQRMDMIKTVFPNIVTLAVPDSNDWDMWYKNIEFNLRCFINDVTEIEMASELDKLDVVWYINNKEKDRTYFEFNGKLYNNQFYSQIFKDLGYTVKEATYPSNLRLDINATDIRNNLETHRHFLDARVYKYIKGIHGGKENTSYFK